jgi:RNA polymerase primary sigma factor
MSDEQKERQIEVLFLQRLQETTKRARQNGNTITEEELADSFADLALDEAQMVQVREYLHKSGIGIGEALPAEEVLTDEERDHLADYEAMLDAIEVPSDNILDAIRLSAMAGERDAQERLTEYSLKKVVDIARLYAGQGVYMEDLIGAGNERLLTAVTQLAPLEKPEEVDGYLGRRIMDAMEDLIALNLDIKAAEKTVEEKVNLVADRAKELAEELGRKVSVAELAKEYEMDPEEIAEAVRLSGNAIADIG